MGEALKQQLREENYIDLLHNSSKGWITRAEINKNKFKQWHYHYLDLIMQDLDSENIYISLNTFYSTYRRLEYLKELKAQFIDLDTYKTGFTKTQIIMNLEENYFNKSIPKPNFIIDSGRGLYLIWLIEAVPSKALPLWKAVEEYLYKVLKPFGADRQALDATRVLRVPGSINTKSNTAVQVVEQYDYLYQLREIQREFLPELNENRPIRKGRPKKLVFVHRERSLYYGRMKDLIKLCELRKYDLSGHRELILFLYRYYLCSYTEDTKKALQDVLELNSQFIQPLGINEAKNVTMSAERCYLSKDKQYKYKNSTLIDLLEITEDEQKHMTSIISNEEYRRRDRVYQQQKYQEQLKAQGKLSEKEKISQRRQKIKNLLGEGFKRKIICSTLNISIKTYKRDIQFLKQQNLI